MLKASIDAAVQMKAIAHPVDSRLLEVARRQLVQAARAVGITFKQAYHKECAALRRKAGGYAHARQFWRLRRIVKRQRTILAILLRECACKLDALQPSPAMIKAIGHLQTVIQRAHRIHQQAAVHRKGDGLLLHRGVHGQTLELSRFNSLHLRGSVNAGLEQLIDTGLTNGFAKTSNLRAPQNGRRL